MLALSASPRLLPALLASPAGWAFLLGVVFMPIDSHPLVLTGTVNRPLWALPFCALALAELLAYRQWPRLALKAALVVLALGMVSALAYLRHGYGEYAGFIKSLITLALAALTFAGIVVSVRRLVGQFGAQQLPVLLALAMGLSLLLPLALGLLQWGANRAGAPGAVEPLTSLFSYRVYGDRVQMASGEPSWAARHLVFVAAALVLVVPPRWRWPLWLGAGVLIFATGSTYGLATYAGAVGLYALFEGRLGWRALASLLFFGALVAGFLLNFKQLLAFSPYAVEKFVSLGTLLSALELKTLLVLAQSDTSILARLLNPLIALQQVGADPWGYGGDAFKYNYLSLLYSYGYEGEESASRLLGAGSTPKVFLVKVAYEFGVPVLLAFLAFLGWLLRRRSLAPRGLKFLLLVGLWLTVSDDSYLFFGVLFPLALLLAVEEMLPPALLGAEALAPGLRLQLLNAAQGRPWLSARRP